MNLSASTGESIEGPSRDQIREVLTFLLPGDDSFAILGSDENHYLQAAGCSEQGFMVEYRDGSDERHFRAVDYGLPLDQVIDVFQAYAGGASSFSRGLTWEPAFAAPPDSEFDEPGEPADPDELLSPPQVDSRSAQDLPGAQADELTFEEMFSAAPDDPISESAQSQEPCGRRLPALVTSVDSAPGCLGVLVVVVAVAAVALSGHWAL